MNRSEEKNRKKRMLYAISNKGGRVVLEVLWEVKLCVGPTIYNIICISNADEKKFYNNKNVKTNIFLQMITRLDKQGNINTKTVMFVHVIYIYIYMRVGVYSTNMLDEWGWLLLEHISVYTCSQ